MLNLSDLTPQSFVKCYRSKTRDVLANRLCEVLKLIDGCQKKIVKLRNSFDQLDEASMIAYDGNVKLVQELEMSRGKLPLRLSTFNLKWSHCNVTYLLKRTVS